MSEATHGSVRSICGKEYVSPDDFGPFRSDGRWIGNMPLKSIDMGRFEYEDGNVQTYGEYKMQNMYASGTTVDVFVFHSTIKPYGKSSVCFTLPKELTARLNDDRYNSIWCVQLYGFSEEDMEPRHTYQKFMRRVGGYDCVSIPIHLAMRLEQRVWTVVIARTSKPILAQFDGFVYPEEFFVGDMFRFRDYMKFVRK